MSSDLVERVARVLMSPKADPSDWRFWTDEASAAIAVVLEEAAKVARRYAENVRNHGNLATAPYAAAEQAADEIVAAIRAMIPNDT